MNGTIQIVSGKRGVHLKVNGLFISSGFGENIKAIKNEFGIPYGATEWVSISAIRKFWHKYMPMVIASTKRPHRSVWGQLKLIEL